VTPGLDTLRERLDRIDDEIARLLGERLEICRDVARYKSKHEIPMMQPERVRAVRERYLQRGAEHNIPLDFSARLFELLIETTCRIEDELMEASAKAAIRERQRQ
jgi:chorismate mutase